MICVSLSLSLSLNMYIYIYIERERDIHTYVDCRLREAAPSSSPRPAPWSPGEPRSGLSLA